MSRGKTFPTRAPNEYPGQPAHSHSQKLFAWHLRLAKDQKRLQVDSEDSDQTVRLRRLICVFAERNAILKETMFLGSINSKMMALCYKWIRSLSTSTLLEVVFHNTYPVKLLYFWGANEKEKVDSFIIF